MRALLAMHGAVLFPLGMKAQQPPASTDIAAFVGDFIKPYLAAQIGSASVAVVTGGRVRYVGSFGFAKPVKRVRASPDSTIYQVGSLSKLFVATAALQLVEQGKLRLDKDVNAYLHDIQVDGRGAPVTMEQILTHTSGIDDRKLGRTQSRAELPLITLGRFFREFPPRRARSGGQEINYSGNAVALGAHVVEEVSGERFDQYAKRHIFEPLGMTRATFEQPLPDSLLRQRAAMPNLPPLITYPAGGLAMTTADMTRFMVAQLTGGRGILRPETVRLMQSHHFPVDPAVPGTAYGFFEAQLAGHRALVHTGDYQHESVLVLVPDPGLGLFFVISPKAELHGPVLTSFVERFFKRFYPSGVATRADPPAKLSEREADPYIGEYRDDAIPSWSIERFFVGLMFGSGDARVSRDSGTGLLYFQPPSAQPIKLAREGPSRFKTVDSLVTAHLTFGDNGSLQVSAGTLGAYSFSRIPFVATQRVQLGFLPMALATFGLWVIYDLTRLAKRFLRRPRTAIADTRQRFADAAASVTAWLGCGGFVLFSVLGFKVPSIAMMTGVPAAFYALAICFTGACVAALPLGLTAIVAWSRRWYNPGIRVLHSAVALAGILFIPFCVYWRLFGIRM